MQTRRALSRIVIIAAVDIDVADTAHREGTTYLETSLYTKPNGRTLSMVDDYGCASLDQPDYLTEYRDRSTNDELLSCLILQDLIKVEHGSTKNSRRLGAVYFVRPFMRSVRNSILCPSEHHCGRALQLGHGTIMRGVCSRCYAFVTTCAAHAIDCPWPEFSRLQMENAGRFDIKTMRARDLIRMCHDLRGHALQTVELLMHQAEDKLGI